MADNFPETPGSGRNVATDQVTYSGDTADVQLTRIVGVTGAEGSKTVTEIPSTAANGLLTDVSRVQKTGTIEDTGNATSTPFPHGDGFAGTVRDALGFSAVSFFVESDRALTLSVTWMGRTLTTPGIQRDYVVVANVNFAVTVPIEARYYFVALANNTGSDATVTFLRTLLHTHPPSAQAVAGVISVSQAAALPAGDNNIGNVDLASALPAGTNNIGDVDIASIAAGDNNIGNVDLASAIPAGTNNIGDVDIATVPAPLNVVGNGSQATALRVTLASDSSGQVVVANSVVVEVNSLPALPAGTNNIGDVDIASALPAGTNNIGDVDVVSSALPAGAATAANQAIVIGHLDGVEGLLTTIDGDTGTLAGAVSGSEMQVDVVTSALPSGAATAVKQDTQITSLGTIAGAVSGTEMQVDVLTLPNVTIGTMAALVAGTANIGDVDVLTLPALPAGSNNIGDVDVLTLPAPLNVTGYGSGATALRVVEALPAPAYLYNIPSQVHVASANTVHWDLFNADATLIVRVVSIRQIPNITTAVTGIVFDWLLERTTAVGTGGSALTAWLADTFDTALDADITARSKPSGGATQSTDLFNYSLSSEETNPATIQIASQGGLELVPSFLQPIFGGKGIVLRQNQGIRVVQVNSSNAGNTGWLISFTVE